MPSILGLMMDHHFLHMTRSWPCCSSCCAFDSWFPIVFNCVFYSCHGDFNFVFQRMNRFLMINKSPNSDLTWRTVDISFSTNYYLIFEQRAQSIDCNDDLWHMWAWHSNDRHWWQLQLFPRCRKKPYQWSTCSTNSYSFRTHWLNPGLSSLLASTSLRRL